MADNLTASSGDVIAAKDVAGVKFPRNILTDASGADLVPLTDSALRASAVPVTIASTPGLTDTQLRASAVPVSISSTTGLTDTQLRATAVPISVASLPGVGDVSAAGTLAAAAATVSLSIVGGYSSGIAQISGTWVGTITFEGTANGTDWVPINAVIAGSSAPSSTTSANGIVRMTPAGMSQIRANMTAFTSGSAAVTLRASQGTGGTFLNQSLTVGSNVIGKVGIDQTTPGTSNGVSVTNASLAVTGSVAVTGTFWQATQPVSIASWTGLTDTQLRASAVPVSGTVAVTNAGTFAVQGTLAAETTKVIGTVNIAAAQTLATVTTVSTVTSVAASTPSTPTAFALSSAATTNATSVKASAGTVYSITASNVGAAAAFLKIFNLAAAPTVGTSVPLLTIPIAPSGVINVNFGSQGMRFGTGIALSITNLVADADATAVVAAQVKVAIPYL